MAEELAQTPKPTLPAGGGRIGFKEAIGVQEPFLKRKAELQSQITAVEGDIAKAQQEQKEVLSTGKAQAQEAYGAAERKAREELQGKLEAEPLPAFVPTKDTAQDIAGLFGLIGVIGMVVGKGNAMQAMGAMNGMLEGHRKGRADLYKQQLAEFDKNFKSMLQKHNEFRREMEDAVKLAATDKEAGMQKAELAATKAGSEIVKAQLRKGDLLGAYKLLEESAKGAEKALDLEAKARESAAREAAANKRAQMQIDAATEREEARARAKLVADTLKRGQPAAAEKVKSLTPSSDERKGYAADNQLKADVSDILSDLKKNPKLVEDLKKYRMEAFLTEEGKVLNQVVNEDIPSDLRKFLTKVRDVRNNYYLNISGKAVTGGEALRSYGTVPQPGDSAEMMVDKLNGMSNRIDQAIQIKRQLYPQLPELRLNPGTSTGLTGSENVGAASSPKFEVGKTYTDAQGNRATYRGVDRSGEDIWDEE